MKIGEGDELAQWHLLRCEKQTRAPMYYLLDERTRLAGCHMIREAVERVILEEGIDRFKQFSREVIEEGRRSFKSRIREMTVPGRYRSAADVRRHLRRQAAAAGAGAARLPHARAVRGADRRRRRLRARHGRRVGVGLALDELHAVGDAGGDLGDVHADADLQRQGQRRRLPGGRDQLPRGHDRQPRRRRGLDRDRLGVPAAGLHRLPAHALAGAPGARLHRGGDRRLLLLRQRDPGRRHRPVRQLVGDHELRDRGAGDGGEVRARRHRHLRGDVQPRGRRRRRRDVGADLPDGLPVAPAQGVQRRAGPPPRRLELRVAADGLEDARSGSSRTSARRGCSAPRGCSAAIPGSAAYVHNIKGADLAGAGRAAARPTRSPTATSTTRRCWRSRASGPTSRTTSPPWSRSPRATSTCR